MVRGGAAASARRRRGSVGRRHIGDNKCAAVVLDTFDETLVNVAQLGVDRLLPLNVLSVQPGNHFSSRLFAVVVRMVAPTQKELPTRSLVVTHPPTAGLMTVELFY
jgi:hypothetical protein